MSVTKSPALEDALRARATTAALLAGLLGISQGLRDDPDLRRLLLSALPSRHGDRAAIRLGHGMPIATLSHSGLVPLEARDAVEPVITLAELISLVSNTPSLSQAFGISLRKSRRLVDALCAGRPTSTDFDKASAHVDLAGPLAYLLSTRTNILVDLARDRLLKTGRNRPAEMQQYQDMVGSAAVLALVSVSGTRSEWFAPMALSFEWQNWSPSFPHTRERTIWSSLVGAHMAGAAGPAVMGRYLESLTREPVPMQAFDLLIGLVAIARRHPECREIVEHHLQSGAGAWLSRQSYVLMQHSAQAALSQPTRELDLRRIVAQIPPVADPAEPDRNGIYPGLALSACGALSSPRALVALERVRQHNSPSIFFNRAWHTEGSRETAHLN